MIDPSSPMKKKLRLTEIARLAGVSIATVSNVLNNKGRMSPETTRKVRRVIHDLSLAAAAGRPDASSPGRSGAIALVSVDPSVKIRHSSFHMQLIQGMQTVLEREGYALTLATCLTPEEFAQQTEGVAAAVVVGFPDNPERWEKAADTPFIWALRSASLACDVVQEDNREIARIAAERLMGGGHKIIAYIDDRHVESLGERGAFLSSFAKQRGGRVVLRVGENLFTAGPDFMSIDAGQVGRLLREILSAKPRPTAMFVPGDRLCVTVYQALRELGVRPGEDMEVLSCNYDIPYLESLFPRPATVGMNIDVIGRRAAETAIWRMRNPLEPPVRVLIQPTLILPPQ